MVELPTKVFTIPPVSLTDKLLVHWRRTVQWLTNSLALCDRCVTLLAHSTSDTVLTSLYELVECCVVALELPALVIV
jgi:hypothetical protein